MTNSNEKDRIWTHIGGDLEASYDGAGSIDIRVRPKEGEKTTAIFMIMCHMSKEALEKALSLFEE
jgi:hypothetical protein